MHLTQEGVNRFKYDNYNRFYMRIAGDPKALFLNYIVDFIITSFQPGPSSGPVGLAGRDLSVSFFSCGRVSLIVVEYVR